MRRGARVAYHDVDKSHASQSTTLTWLVARRLQDSAAAIVALSFDRAEKAATAETGCNKPIAVGFGADDDYDAFAWCR